MSRASQIAERLTAIGEHIRSNGGTQEEAIEAIHQHAQRLGYSREELAAAVVTIMADLARR